MRLLNYSFLERDKDSLNGIVWSCTEEEAAAREAGADGYLFYTAVSLDIMSLYISCVHAFTVTDKTESFESFAGIMASTTIRCKIYGPPRTIARSTSRRLSYTVIRPPPTSPSPPVAYIVLFHLLSFPLFFRVFTIARRGAYSHHHHHHHPPPPPSSTPFFRLLLLLEKIWKLTRGHIFLFLAKALPS